MALNNDDQKLLTIFCSFPTAPFTDILPNGDGLVAYNFVHELVARGHRVHVVTPWAHVSSSGRRGIILHELDSRDTCKQFNSFLYMLKTRHILRTVMKEEPVHIIHELNPVFTALSLAFMGIKVPLVLGPHSSRWPLPHHGSAFARGRARLKEALKNCIVGLQHRRADAILLSTPAALNNVQEARRLKQHLFVVPPGIDSHSFSPEPFPIDEQRTTSVLFLANLYRRKGIFTLLQAFEYVWAQAPNTQLTIAGDGPELPEVKRHLSSSRHQHNVRFVGHVDRLDIPCYMRTCTVYCLPSIGEPFGMTALEAMACGKALVVTQAGGLGYLVTNEGGRRVPAGDPRALAAALLELLGDKDLVTTMGVHNRDVVETRYTWPVVAQRLECVYKYILGVPTEIGSVRISGIDLEREVSLRGN